MQSQSQDSDVFHHIDEDADRLDEQHVFTVATLGFLIHPNIPPVPQAARIADVGTGSGIWLLDVAKNVPPACQLTGFDISSSAFPPRERWPPNVRFETQDMCLPFPDSELGQYDVVATRFVSSATTRTEWARSITNIITLLKPGGWLQWIDSCNFALYNSVAGTSRAACQEIYDALEPMRAKDDLVIGMMMREPRNVRREDVLREIGLLDVHEDVFSTERLANDEKHSRRLETKNAINCFVGCLEGLVAAGDATWTKERIEQVKARAMKEIDDGVYHTLDHVCVVARKA